MKMHLALALIVALGLAWSQRPKADDDHKEHAAEEKHEEGHEHAEGDEHGEEEGEHGEGSAKVGPGKGITEKGPLGFKMSPEALKTIGFKTMPFNPSTTTLACNIVVHVKAEKFVFRSRDGWLKKEPVIVNGRNGSNCNVQFKNLQSGDLIVVDQLGFLRIAEVFLEEGASHSHSH